MGEAPDCFGERISPEHDAIMGYEIMHKKEKEGVLFAFPDFYDPYRIEGYKGIEHQGPILSLLHARRFHRIFLFLLPEFAPRPDLLTAEIRALDPEADIHTVDCSDCVTHDQIESMRLLRVRLKTVKYKNRELPLTLCWGEIPYPDVYIGLAGLLLSGELPARLIVVRSPEATAFGLSRFVELDFNAGIFSSDMLDIPLAPSDKMSLRRQAEQFGIIGSHSIMQHVVDVCQILAPSSLPMLLLGETGTGKGLLARYIHALSGRPMDRFISVNCAAIPESLAESVLFGHKKGAFTGAVADQEGKFDAADGGTLFLDEIGELSLPIQAKILRAVEDGIIDPIGSKKTHKVNVRLICATNRNLAQFVDEGKFRADLYYRLNVGEVHVPPLRRRREDIGRIVLHVVSRINATLPLPKIFTRMALKVLENYDWPGNIRELENVLERTLRLSPKNMIDAEDVLFPDAENGMRDTVLNQWHPGIPLDEYLGNLRQEAFRHALMLSGGNRCAAAKLLGISPQAVGKYLKTHPDIM